MTMDKVINILLVEDDTLDVMDAKRTLDKMGILHIMHVAKNGEEALKHLERVSSENGVKPDVILLDLNMPKMNGMEFLSILRKDDQWKNVKVFILTTSEEKEDKEAAKKLGVSGFIVKPLKLNNPSSIDSFNLMIDLLNFK
ncbi:response regulator [Fulvivirgaceae bacterium PWU20]|uniref:Response regulator n=2 Tax=Chryseosolibacter indicus TaxID=2782351 RepID=A0ABS5VT55_9BACT|nr:response regulator [Chryseosolibacter indicus]